MSRPVTANCWASVGIQVYWFVTWLYSAGQGGLTRWLVFPLGIGVRQDGKSLPPKTKEVYLEYTSFTIYQRNYNTFWLFQREEMFWVKILSKFGGNFLNFKRLDDYFRKSFLTLKQSKWHLEHKLKISRENILTSFPYCNWILKRPHGSSLKIKHFRK